MSIQTIASAVQAASRVVEDPYLPEVSCQVLRLNKIQKGQDPGPPCVRTVGVSTTKGVGLGVIRGPLRTFVWARQNPLLAMGVGAGVIGIIWYVGYSMGKRK